MTIPAPCFLYWPRASKGFMPTAMSFARNSTGYVIGPAGLLIPASNNVPRLQYDPTIVGNAQGELIEQSSTNILLQSKTLNNAAWTQINSPNIASSAITPFSDGTGSWQITTSASGSGVYQFITVSNATQYTFSIYVKYVSGTSRMQLGCGTPTNGYIIFDSSTGTVITVGSAVAGSIITALLFGWYKVTVTVTTTSTSLSCVCFNSLSSASVNLVSAVQVEMGLFASSPILTTSAAVTRAADALSIPLTSIAGYNSAAGTLMVSGWTPVIATPATDAAMACLDDGSTNNQIKIRYTTTGHIVCDLVGGTGVSLDLGAYAANTYFAIVFGWSAGGQAASLNGGSCVTGSAATLPSSVANLRIGSAYAANWANAPIARVALYSRQLTNAEIQAICA